MARLSVARKRAPSSVLLFAHMERGLLRDAIERGVLEDTLGFAWHE
jgi:hypothetical protein